MLTFPSLEWFQELVRLMNDNDAPYRRLGYADVNWAIEMQPSEPGQPAYLFVFEFEEYSCKSVKACEPDSQPDVAFTMRATLGTWEEMIRNIQENQGPDLQHTLNFLALPDDPIYIDAPDFLSRDLFARYGQTFQLFFNGAIQVPTAFSG